MAITWGKIWENLKKIDAYPKSKEELEEFQTKTIPGAIVTIVATVCIVFLFISESYDWLTPQITEDLYVDTTRGSKLKINVDVVFHSIPCDMLSLDAVDLTGEQHVNIQHNLYRRRLNLNGEPLEDPQQQVGIGHGPTIKSLDPKNITMTEKPACGSCYGAEYGQKKCCNSCDEVKDAYRKKGWAMPNLSGIEQCLKEGKTSLISDLPKEGCQLYGYLEVNRVGGNFHIAPGKSFQHSHLHVHDVQQYKVADFDMSHTIRHLSFGTSIHGKTNPIDGLKHHTTKGPRNINYYIKIVPTLYENKDGATLTTNQFSVTQHEKEISVGLFENSLPGVFFTYELSPLMMKYTEGRRSFGHYLTGLCAIMGGIFATAGLIDAFIYHSLRAFQEKLDLGKTT